jgi:hypothetical protein
MSKPQFVLEPVQFGLWVVLSDPAATRQAYARIGDTRPVPCNCYGCQNFNRVRDQIYPAEVLSLFDRLGITPHREAEIYEGGPDTGGLHTHGGWYHFVGRIKSGGDARVQKSPNWGGFDLMPVGETFSLGFTEYAGLVHEAFDGYPVVQIEFVTHVPWVLETRWWEQ